jgi:Mn-dependent DtxR family transcriptional regulator
VAYEDACRVEHYISAETFQCMKAHYLKNKHD